MPASLHCSVSLILDQAGFMQIEGLCLIDVCREMHDADLSPLSTARSFQRKSVSGSIRSSNRGTLFLNAEFSFQLRFISHTMEML